jgi:hypothetical protein
VPFAGTILIDNLKPKSNNGTVQIYTAKVQPIFPVYDTRKGAYKLYVLEKYIGYGVCRPVSCVGRTADGLIPQGIPSMYIQSEEVVFGDYY